MKPAALRWATGLALLVLIAATLALRDRFDAAALSAWVQDARAAGPAVFIAVYAAATVLFLPGALLTLVGGALFGPVWGTLWNLTGATFGSALAFLIARYLGADWVSRRAGPRLQRLNDGVADEGWRFIAFVRLVPLFPFNLLNFALGLTRIRFATYVVASAVFIADQEHGLRPGTENVASIVALGAAAALASTSLPDLSAQLQALRDPLHAQLEAGVSGLQLNGHPNHRLPNTLHVSFPGVSGRALLADAADTVAASVGSACHSEHDAVSGVLAAMGIAAARASGAVRLSVGRTTRTDDIDRAALALVAAWTRLVRP
jgi:uncharacterized membrane protein YdjX (TVP38/TMEM64 family)